MTAAIGLFLRLELPDPWTPSPRSIPLIIYGGSTAVGSYAIKLAVRANIHPLIVVAGGGAHYVEKLIDRTKGDTIIDYRPGPDAVVAKSSSTGVSVPLGVGTSSSSSSSSMKLWCDSVDGDEGNE